MRAVNLIPPEDRRGDHAPLRAGATSYAIVGVLAFALIGVVMVILSGNKINDSTAELASLEARKAQADLAAADLAPYEEFGTLSAARSETVSSLAQSRFDWERVLNELALVIPERVTFESLSGTVGGGASAGDATAAAPTGSSVVSGPSLEITGCAPGQKGVARFLAALKDIDGVTRVGMQSSELGASVVPGQATPGADAATTDSATTGTGTTDCQTAPEIARFHVTVAFDAVPPPVAPTAPAAAVPATADATTTSDPAVADAQSQQQAAADSATQQVDAASNAATAVGMSGK